MAFEPPQPADGPARRDGRRPDRQRPAHRRDASRRWARCSTVVWYRLRAFPAWLQAVLWFLAWPVVGALYVATRGWLGRMAPPLTAGILLAGGMLWWGEPLLGGGGNWPQARATASGTSLEGAWAAPPGAAPTAGTGEGEAQLPEFDASTLRVEVVECVQTRSVSSVHHRTIRQPRLTVRVTNLGPERTVVLHGAVLLDAYGWNGGWKPTLPAESTLRHGGSAEVTLMPNYRHQGHYVAEGLRACKLIEVEMLAPQVWPEHPPRVVSPMPVAALAGPERSFDPVRDLPRTDAR